MENIYAKMLSREAARLKPSKPIFKTGTLCYVSMLSQSVHSRLPPRATPLFSLYFRGKLSPPQSLIIPFQRKPQSIPTSRALATFPLLSALPIHITEMGRGKRRNPWGFKGREHTDCSSSLLEFKILDFFLRALFIWSSFFFSSSSFSSLLFFP